MEKKNWRGYIMSLVDHTQSIKVPYSPEDTFKALQSAVMKVEGFQIDQVDETLKTVYAKAGVSLFSWGENINVSVEACSDGTSEVSVLSTPKTGALFGGAADMGKNRKNIAAISTALSNELKNYAMVQMKQKNDNSVADEIKKLAELRDQGILTEEEFSKKKNELLNL